MIYLFLSEGPIYKLLMWINSRILNNALKNSRVIYGVVVFNKGGEGVLTSLNHQNLFQVYSVDIQPNMLQPIICRRDADQVSLIREEKRSSQSLAATKVLLVCRFIMETHVTQ